MKYRYRLSNQIPSLLGQLTDGWTSNPRAPCYDKKKTLNLLSKGSLSKGWPCDDKKPINSASKGWLEVCTLPLLAFNWLELPHYFFPVKILIKLDKSIFSVCASAYSFKTKGMPDCIQLPLPMSMPMPMPIIPIYAYTYKFPGVRLPSKLCPRPWLAGNPQSQNCLQGDFFISSDHASEI